MTILNTPHEFDFRPRRAAPRAAAPATTRPSQFDGYNEPYRYHDIEDQPLALQSALDAIFADPDCDDVKIVVIRGG